MICWKIRIFAYWTTPRPQLQLGLLVLWFAEKFVSLLIEQHPDLHSSWDAICCDLLKNSYLCLLNNTACLLNTLQRYVVICWKIRIFAYWTTPVLHSLSSFWVLWFAEKFVSLLIEQHRGTHPSQLKGCCDLLKNSYLCLLNNTCYNVCVDAGMLWFAEKFVSLLIEQHPTSANRITCSCCDLLKNSYLCLLNNTFTILKEYIGWVVICWKIRIFAYWTTPEGGRADEPPTLWFAEKFVSLLIEQHRREGTKNGWWCCDLLKNSYLCLLNNT